MTTRVRKERLGTDQAEDAKKAQAIMIYHLTKLGWPQKRIACFLNISSQTVTRRYEEYVHNDYFILPEEEEQIMHLLKSEIGLDADPREFVSKSISARTRSPPPSRRRSPRRRSAELRIESATALGYSSGTRQRIMPSGRKLLLGKRKYGEVSDSDDESDIIPKPEVVWRHPSQKGVKTEDYTTPQAAKAGFSDQLTELDNQERDIRKKYADAIVRIEKDSTLSDKQRKLDLGDAKNLHDLSLREAARQRALLKNEESIVFP